MLLLERPSASDGPTPPSEPGKGPDASRGFLSTRRTRSSLFSLRAVAPSSLAPLCYCLRCLRCCSPRRRHSQIQLTCSLSLPPFFPPSDLHVTRRGGRWQRLPASRTILASLLLYVTSVTPKMILSSLLCDIHSHRSGGHGGQLPVSRAPSLPPSLLSHLVCCDLHVWLRRGR